MMIKRIFAHIVFLVFACPVFLFATDDFNKESVALGYQPRLSGELYNFFYRPLGSYYLHNNWIKGDVLLISGEMVSGELLKYNSYLDELIWMSTKTYKPVKVDKKLVKEFYITFPNQIAPAVFKNITFEIAYLLEVKNIYAQQMYSGNISLMAHRRMRSTGRIYRSPDGNFPKLEADPVFYIIKEDDKAYEVARLSRRSLYRIFPEQKSEIRTAFRQARLMIRSENDLIRAVALIDEILAQ